MISINPVRGQTPSFGKTYIIDMKPFRRFFDNTFVLPPSQEQSLGQDLYELTKDDAFIQPRIENQPSPTVILYDNSEDGRFSRLFPFPNGNPSPERVIIAFTNTITSTATDFRAQGFNQMVEPSALQRFVSKQTDTQYLPAEE